MTNEKIKIGEKEYFINPLSSVALLKIVFGCLDPKVNPLDNPVEYTLQMINVMVKIVQAALAPAYPDITIEDVANILHFGTGQPLIEAIKKGVPAARAISDALPTVEAIMQFSSQSWEWDSHITKH